MIAEADTRPQVVKISSGAAMGSVAAGANKKVERQVNGGAALIFEGNMAQYSLYTYAIAGYTRDRFGTIIVAARVGLFREDTYDRVAGPVLSDPVTGYYAFATPSPISLPITYWVSVFKANYQGIEDVQGRTRENLVAQPALVQGSE
jgi:hypothetical protein